MRSTMMRIVLVVGMIGIAGCIAPPGSEKTVKKSASQLSVGADGTIVPPPVAVKPDPIPGFMRGINLGNGLDAPQEGEWGVVLVENHFKMPKDAGLDHVRLPVRFSAHALAEPPYTIDEEFFQRVDWALDMAEKYGLHVLLDLHHYEEIMKEPHQHLDRLVALWEQIARRYKDRPDTVAFELLNEPCDKLTVDILNPLMERVWKTVRQTNPHRLIFVDSYFWSSTEWLDKVDVSYMDDQTVVTFHMYQPILFTHQGAPWMGPEFHTRGVVFPGPPEKPVEVTGAAFATDWVRNWFYQYNTLPPAENPSGPKTIYEEFGRATAFVEATGKRVYLGEFGAVDFADPDSRLRFLTMVRKESERRGIGWCYWDDGGNNKGMNVQDETWVPLVHKALFD